MPTHTRDCGADPASEVIEARIESRENCSRRSMLNTMARGGVAACALSLIGGCSAADSTQPEPVGEDDGVGLSADEIRVQLARIPAGASRGCVRRQQCKRIVIRMGGGLRALNGAHTGLRIFTQRARMQRPCHGSGSTRRRNVDGRHHRRHGIPRCTLSAAGMLVVARRAASAERLR